jgi:hypothetical protein
MQIVDLYKCFFVVVVVVVVVPCISINIKVFCDQQMHTLLT